MLKLSDSWGESKTDFKVEVDGFNPLSPDIHLQILQSDLHTFP